MESWQLITDGTPRQFVDALVRESRAHAAVRHPYLEFLAKGELPDVTGALRDYAFQYSFYSAEFPSYVEGVIGGLQSPRHRDVLRANLEEEKGDPESDDPAEQPHVVLFQRFRDAIGAGESYARRTKPCTTALVWRDLFLQKCQSRQEGVGLGAIGLATESIVPTIYGYILEAIRQHTVLQPPDYFFFELHAECDAEHGAEMEEITVELAREPELREAIRFGVFSSLNLRKAFWDILLSRAVAMSAD